MPAPALDQHLGLIERRENLTVQHLVAQSAVETLDIAALLAGEVLKIEPQDLEERRLAISMPFEPVVAVGEPAMNHPHRTGSAGLGFDNPLGCDELCLNLGDGVGQGQAAAFSWPSSTPSVNLTPVITFGN
jgi:hypothetical protein